MKNKIKEQIKENEVPAWFTRQSWSLSELPVPDYIPSSQLPWVSAVDSGNVTDESLNKGCHPLGLSFSGRTTLD